MDCWLPALRDNSRIPLLGTRRRLASWNWLDESRLSLEVRET